MSALRRRAGRRSGLKRGKCSDSQPAWTMVYDFDGKPGDDGEEARRFTRARRGCGGMKTDPGAATGGCQIISKVVRG